MNTEQKINAIMRYIVSETREEKNMAIAEIKKIMSCQELICENDNVDEAIDLILTEIGIPSGHSGYNYLIYAIKVVIENPEQINHITYGLYPVVAQKYNTTAARVERAIRCAIEAGFDRADPEIIKKYFGNAISPNKGKATNSEFIARIANIIKWGIANG